jgi:hypothetical protein
MVELKWAQDQFLPSLQPTAQAHGITPRSVETVRAKMRRLGLIDQVSRFNAKHGYREGWVPSNRFQRSLQHLAKLTTELRTAEDPAREKKDRLLIQLI